MKSKRIRIVSSCLLLLSFAVGVLFTAKTFNNNIQGMLGQGLNPDGYFLSFDNSTNTFPSGEGQTTIKTKNNNDVRFTYSGISSSDNWGYISNGGFIANQDPINGLKSLSINYFSTNSNKLSISYGWEETMYYQEEITNNQTYYFNNQFPSYFRIDNLTGNKVDITSMNINYSCSPSENHSINDGFISTISNHHYIIDVLSLTLPNLHNAYEHALNIDDDVLNDIDEITINLPQGSLFLDNTIAFTGERKNNTPIRIKGNNSTIYGGHELSKGIWELYKDGIYRASIGQKLNKFSTLIVNDEAKCLAKTDLNSFAYSYSNKRITINKNKLNLSSVSGACEFVSLENWAQSIAVVNSISSSGSFSITHTLNLDANGQTIFYDRVPSYRPTETTSITGYLQDNLAFLDEVGEWFYDKDEGYLYYKPLDGSSINEDNFVIPNVETILDTDEIVDNVIIDGLIFNGTNFASPLINGFAETQSSWYYDPSDNQNKTISGMVHINSIGTRFVNCTFKNSSNAAIFVDVESVNLDINNNQIINSGSCGITIGQPTNAREGEIPENTTISNNAIDNYGTIYQGSPGICAFYADVLTINNNNVSNGAYSAISVGWGWLYTQTSYGHNRYRILNNRVSSFMNSAFHDGGGIYTLGGFPNQLGEIYNEISGNYIEVNYQINGGIYLDEGSSSWDVHNNVVNVTNSGSTYHGVIMMHDPIDALNGTNNSQFANHISNNYYSGDVDGSENRMQLTYSNNGGSYYSGTSLTNYNNSRNIVFDTPISGSETFVNNSIYILSGISKDELYPFINESRFSQMISGYSNLSLDSVNGYATFDTTTNGFVITSNYISDLIKKGYYTLSISIDATSLNSTQACYAIYITSGSLSWNVYYSQTALSNNMVIPLDKFNVEGATCKVQIRDVNGLSLDNNLPARVTLGNLAFSYFPPLKTNTYDDISLISSYNNEFVYQANNISYDWKRIIFDGMGIAMNKGYPRVRITISGNHHNLYIFKTDGSDIDYNNQIPAEGGAVTIDLEDSARYIAIMTSHENWNIPGGQDNEGIYGTSENMRISFKFISSNYEDVLFSRKTVSTYFSGMTIHNVSNNTATISFTGSRMRITHDLIEKLINNSVSAIEFDILVPETCDVKSIVSCWFGGPNNTDVTYSDEGTFFKDENNIIHVTYYANRFNQAYDIELVSRDINGYSGSDINLVNATLMNFSFAY